jgi:hypothetical protein
VAKAVLVHRIDSLASAMPAVWDFSASAERVEIGYEIARRNLPTPLGTANAAREPRPNLQVPPKRL